LLDQLPLNDRLSPSLTERARKYAYHFFFRRMIPLSFMQPDIGGLYRLEIQSIHQLMPGREPGLDVICDGILQGNDFIYPAERLARNAEKILEVAL